jgi:hypothetical protein
MLLVVSVSSLWLLGMLAAAAHAQDAGRTGGNALRIALAFAAVPPLALWLAPQPNWVGVLVATGAFWRLINGPMPRVGGWLAGASAGLVAALQIAGGIGLELALAVTALALVCAFPWWGAAQPRRWEWLLVGVAVLVPPIGLASDIVYGWQSAAVLSREQASSGTGAGLGPGLGAEAIVPPAWALAIMGAALLAGLARGIWIRR